MNIMDMSAVKLAEKIRNKEVSVIEVTKESLKKIKEDASSINSFITIDEENALKRAKYVQKQIDSGNINSPVAGVVVGADVVGAGAGVEGAGVEVDKLLEPL